MTPQSDVSKQQYPFVSPTLGTALLPERELVLVARQALDHTPILALFTQSAIKQYPKLQSAQTLLPAGKYPTGQTDKKKKAYTLSCSLARQADQAGARTKPSIPA